MKLLLRWVILAAALFGTVFFIPGIRIEGTNAIITVAVTAIVLGFVNAFIRPILKILSCGLIIITLGFFSLVINAGTLMLASSIANSLGIGFHVDGFWPAFWGSIVLSILSMILSSILIDD
jgi:putative membrane protein